MPSNELGPKVFGCVSFVHNHSPNRSELDPRAIKCIFVGSSSTQKGYKCFHLSSKRFFVSTDVSFVKESPYFSNSFPQGEIKFLEEKNRELFLPILPSSSSNHSLSYPKDIPQDSLNVIHRKNLQPFSSPLKVYSKRKSSVPNPMHVESFEPGPESYNPNSEPTSSPI